MQYQPEESVLESRAPHRKTAEREWEAPSGRVPGERKPASLKSALAKLVRGASARGGLASRGKGRISTPMPSARSRRVVVKVRVVQVSGDYGKKAAKLHLGYIERDGTRPDGGPGALYGESGRVERSDFEEELAGEKHQFRIVLSPEDGRELDLEAYVRSYMGRVERDVGRKLRWAAVNHYDTDNPHAHIVIRGVDAAGREVRFDRQYVSHGLRHSAQELATQELGPRPERARDEQLAREAELERYTELDRALERRASKGIVERPRKARDSRFEAALGARLLTLERLGLSTRRGRGKWALSPGLRGELGGMERRAEGMRAIRRVLDVPPERCRVIERGEPREGHREELEKGVRGVLRWKGLDEQGQFCAVIETTGGAAYHLPIASRAAHELRGGQVLDLKRAVDKDQMIEAAARERGWSYDVTAVAEPMRQAFRRRLEQLERMGLSKREGELWRLRPDFRAELAKGKAQPYWQMLSIRADRQALSDQVAYPGHVWIDRIGARELGATGFGREVRNRLERRHEYLRSLGLDPADPALRWKLRELQQERLEQSLGGTRAPAKYGFEGILHLHDAPNGERFAELRSADGRFVVCAAPRGSDALLGRAVRLEAGEDRRVRLVATDRDIDKGRERK